MIYLISWQGRGLIALLGIFLAVGIALPGAAFNDDICFFLLTIGWVVSGVMCFILGRRWNQIADVHRFCTLRLQTWGKIYIGIGLFLMPYACLGLRLRYYRH